MSGNDDAHARGARLDVDLCEIVDGCVDEDLAEADQLALAQGRRPGAPGRGCRAPQ